MGSESMGVFPKIVPKAGVLRFSEGMEGCDALEVCCEKALKGTCLRKRLLACRGKHSHVVWEMLSKPYGLLRDSLSKTENGGVGKKSKESKAPFMRQ